MKENPTSLQFQEEIYDLRKILQLKIKQEKEDQSNSKADKYIRDLQ